MKVKNYPNKKGDMQIFPSSTYHKVDPVSSDRISLGGTIHHQTSIPANIDYLSLNNKRQHGLTILSK